MKLIVQVYEFSIYYQFFLSKELVVILLPGTTKPVFQSCIRNGFLALMCVEICMFLSDVLPISLLWPLCLVVSIYWRILLLALHVTPLHYLRPSFTVLSCVCVCVVPSPEQSDDSAFFSMQQTGATSCRPSWPWRSWPEPTALQYTWYKLSYHS